MEPPDNVTLLDYIVYIAGGVVLTVLGWLGKNRHPDPPSPTAVLSGALMDNRAVDPLVAKLSGVEERLTQTGAALIRLCDLMEAEVGLRVTAVEEIRRREDQKALALAVADQVREDILEEMRREIHGKEPAPMPPTRKRT